MKFPVMEEREPEIVYCGWIPARWSDEEKLRALGVYGQMAHRKGQHYGKLGVFEKCYAAGETMMRLILEYNLPNPGSFTAVDALTDQVLPKEYQTNWKDICSDLITLI